MRQGADPPPWMNALHGFAQDGVDYVFLLHQATVMMYHSTQLPYSSRCEWTVSWGITLTATLLQHRLQKADLPTARLSTDFRKSIFLLVMHYLGKCFQRHRRTMIPGTEWKHVQRTQEGGNMGEGSILHVVRRERAFWSSSLQGHAESTAPITPSRLVKQWTHRGRSSGSHRSPPPWEGAGHWGMKALAPGHSWHDDSSARSGHLAGKSLCGTGLAKSRHPQAAEERSRFGQA